MDIDEVQVKVSPLCEHPKRCSRERFYSTLFSYSTTPDVKTFIEGSNAPISEEELTMMREWIVICSASTVGLRSLPEDEQERKALLKDNHRLHLFARDSNVADSLAYIKSHRVLTYPCDCNDSRCICGEESVLSYIYNTKTHFVLTVGTTCAKTVKMASVNYKRCCDCGNAIRTYSLRNLGRCNKCMENTKLSTGLKAGQEIESVVKDFSYNPSDDSTISLADSARILMKREKLCTKCANYINFGIRGEGALGWKEGRMCAGCVLRSKVTLESGKDAVTTVLVHPYEPFTQALKSGNSVSNRDLLLLAYIHSLFQTNYFATGSSIVAFGKHSLKSKREMVEKFSEYIAWCRKQIDSPSQAMVALIAYSDLHDRYTSVTGWPE